MPLKATTLGELKLDECFHIAEKVADTAAQVTAAVSSMGRTAATKIDKGLDATAHGLEQAASALNDGADRVAGLANDAAGKLNSTAGFVREHDVKSMRANLRAIVRTNPGRSLLIAAGIGFLVGRAFRRSD